jgi:hypothetical protein
VTVTRELGAVPGIGHVLVRTGDRTTAVHSPHLRLAGARAWLEVARALQTESKFEDASTAATRGIVELGPDYRPQHTEDDTALGLHAADDAAQHGRTGEATGQRIGILGSRIELYVKRYIDTVK